MHDTPEPNGTRRAPAAVEAPRRVSPEPLNVAPGLVGQPLATPGRRLAAMAIDLAVVALLSNLGGFGLAAGLLLVAVQLREAPADAARWRRWAGAALLAVFVVVAAREAWLAWRAHVQPARPAAVAQERRADGDVDAEPDDEAALRAAVKKIGEGLPDAARIALLEEALLAARRSEKAAVPATVNEEIERGLDALGASFGWGVVYFSLLPAFWRGQSLGKKLVKIRVVELTGKPMTVMRCLRRYGGYAAGMATGGLGFLQLLWDANRQAIQDRAAHTVVIDVR